MSPASGGRAEKAIILIRILVGGVFLSEGIQKFLFPNDLGAGRFHRIGIPWPHETAVLVAVVEILCGAAVLLGLETRWAAIGLLCVNVGAILTTKVPLFKHTDLWTTLHDSRVDACMLFSLLFLLLAGSGSYALESRRG
jgi:putative oxidoreductase